MRLDSLIGELAGDAGSSRVTGFAIDNRKVAPGTIFGAFQGAAFNGEDFIPAAIEAGAIAVVARPEAKVEGAIHIADANPRKAFAMIASRFFAPFPAHVAAITGTNGKTSTVEMTRQLWRMAGFNAASIGTLGITTADEQVRTGLTTPDIVTFLSNMAGLEREGVTHAIFEASSHGLDQYRIAGVPVSVVGFSNLSRDHLDYHGTMRRYKAAKARLFRWPTLSHAVVNMDDAFGSELAQHWKHRRAAVLGYGFARRSARLRGHCVEGRNLRLGLDGISFDIASPWGRATLESPLIGRFNATNLLGSLATLLASDVGLDQSVAALHKATPVPGRTERYGGGRAPLVIIDYAHTPDALEKVLESLSAVTGGKARLLCVFGCGGDRDRGKRPLMGEVASRHADQLILTSDNPRSEDPAAIIAQIAKGVRSRHEQIIDRRQAIQTALAEARRGDIVLVAGKGHEQYQEINGVRRRYSDAAVVRAALAGRTR